MERQGNLSINSDNIFPIIKKWLYSDQDIFIRELISNGCDAITKLKKLAVMGDYEEVEGEEYKIEVYASAKDKTLTFVDNGLGMTEEEVDKYINQIAFPVRRTSSTSTRTRLAMSRSSDILDLVFIPHLWLPIR